MIGLSNALALEGSSESVTSNIVLPGAVTRMADGRDISHYPPMNPGLMAPLVAWLAHEWCSITGEMLISMAGRVAKALVVETPGVYRSSWSIEEIADSMDVIRNTAKTVIFPVVPKGFYDHIEHGFGMARSH
jgi:hypothetical protein